MHQDHVSFMASLTQKRRVRLVFHSKEDATDLARTCAPLDYGPSRQAHDKAPRYHFWDYDSDQAPHPLSLLPAQIVLIEGTTDAFDPGEFITWDMNERPWFTPRDWGTFS